MSSWFSCKACSNSDSTTDTVKVNMPVVITEEELKRQQEAADEAARQQAAAEAEAQAARLRQEEAKRAAEEEACRRAEERRRAEEAAAQAERVRIEREEQQRRAQEAALAERRRLELEKQAADRAKADAWLKKNGFGDVAAKKKSMFSSTHALHVAVKENNAEIIRCLLAAGADPALQNSNGQTPAQLAQKSDKKGSHGAALDALGGAPPVAAGGRSVGGA